MATVELLMADWHMQWEKYQGHQTGEFASDDARAIWSNNYIDRPPHRSRRNHWIDLWHGKGVQSTDRRHLEAEDKLMRSFLRMPRPKNEAVELQVFGSPQHCHCAL